jgi:ppGpp synthetase/RelA/SpoT-type nucleotidyltranferase
MPSAKFTYSKNEVSRAGDILVHTPENIGALDILTDFRSAHIYPLSNIQDNLRKIAKKSTKNPSTVIISQRLKRMPSILAKLERQP